MSQQTQQNIEFFLIMFIHDHFVTENLIRLLCYRYMFAPKLNFLPTTIDFRKSIFVIVYHIQTGLHTMVVYIWYEDWCHDCAHYQRITVQSARNMQLHRVL